MSDQACETGTAPTASDKSASGAADVQNTDGLWPVGGGAVNSNRRLPSVEECLLKKEPLDIKFIVGTVILVAVLVLMGSFFWRTVAEQAAIVKEEEAKEDVKPVKTNKEETDKDSNKESDSSSDGHSISATASDVELLAALLECEAGSSNYEALLAVGSVVVNRMKNRHYPDTVRGVIYQTGQFPPAHDGKVDKVLKRGVKDLCVQAAKDALAGKNNVGDCLSFRASSSGRDGIVIGDNVFF